MWSRPAGFRVNQQSPCGALLLLVFAVRSGPGGKTGAGGTDAPTAFRCTTVAAVAQARRTQHRVMLRVEAMTHLYTVYL